MSNKLVSIVTPTYNQAQFIDATIRSVLEQTYDGIEYIVIDAMSTDSTPEILDRYRDRISLVIREPDSGQSDAIQKGFRLAKGELIGWLNSDDILYPDCVSKLVDAYSQHPSAGLYVCNSIDIVDSTGNKVDSVSVPKLSLNRLLRIDPTIIQPGSFFNKPIAAQVGFLDQELRYSMDLDIFLRLLRETPAVEYSLEPVAAYRDWHGTKTATGGRALILERMRLLGKHGGRFWDAAQLKLFLALLRHAFR